MLEETFITGKIIVSDKSKLYFDLSIQLYNSFDCFFFLIYCRPCLSFLNLLSTFITFCFVFFLFVVFSFGVCAQNFSRVIPVVLDWKLYITVSGIYSVQWFEQVWPPQTHMFECLTHREWHDYEVWCYWRTYGTFLFEEVCHHRSEL